MTTTIETKNVSFGKYRFETFEEERNGKTFYFIKKYRATPKAKYHKEKCEYYYRYSTEVQRDEILQKEIESFNKREQQKEDADKKRTEMRENFTNPYNVGDLFYDSWGYDQTNIDFFQVVEVGRMSVKLRKIGQIYIRGGGCSMSEYVKPDKDRFIGQEFRTIIQFSKYDLKPYLNARRGSLMPCTESEEHYQSHYA